ncbi:hypothetical protein [Cellulomonas xiejunii]|uniref:Uncharacterized protein n=1 Tax=Cellulomonas xiejunii TaxID=2968083 RepID=A0ABY5KRH1_9CELL|nr:hypothetical protein [Cellulomonas xiejunii]MCC2321789.1 hypothetical protein [Cellulomonas xiejunii]UUI73096.1 hypothetical protein NP048_06550 [Cellulomonas xiejunii]
MRLLLLPLLLLPLAALGAIAAAVATARTPRVPGSRTDVETSPTAYARARRHAAVVAGVSWAALVIVALALPQTIPTGPDQGIVLGCAPAVAGVLALLVAAVGERTWSRPADPVRRASLARRTVRDVTPHAPAVLTLAWSAALLLVLLATALTADTDDGRSVTVRHGADATSGAGPYPGTPYGVPIAASVALLLVAALLTLHLVATRPAVSHVSTTDDARLRRAGARRVLAAVQLVVGATLAGVLLVTGTSLRNASRSGYDVGEGWVESIDPVVDALGVAGLVAALVVLVATLVVTGVALTRASHETAPDRTSVVPA